MSGHSARPRLRSKIEGRAAARKHHSMTLFDTLILVAYFFILSILAVYGWHRYFLVFQYMKHKDRVPGPPPAVRTRVAGRHDPAADLQRDVRRRSAGRRGVGDRLPEGPARDSGARRLDRRDARDRGAGGAAAAARGFDIKYLHRTDRTGFKAGALEAGLHGRRAASSSRFSTPTSCRRRISCARTVPYFTDTKLGAGAGALGASQSGLLAAHARAGGAARRPLRARARRARNRSGCFFNFNGTAGVWRRDGDSRRRRLAARHADRGSRLSAIARRCAAGGSCSCRIW